jgi:hypothetical protein
LPLVLGQRLDALTDNRQQMMKDTDLDALRSRADFKEWLADLEKNSGKPPQ